VSESTILGRAAVAQRGRKLEYFTITWNTIEGLLAIALGSIAGSISLVGFGLDSFIEVMSGTALLWRMSVDADEERRELNERRTLRMVGICFLLLALYISYESGADLWLKRAPEHSVPGVILACISLAVMPILSRAKRKVGRELNSVAMQADAKQTDFCVYLSAILVAGLVLNALFNFWWADPVGALVMVPLIAREGIEALRGEKCNDCRITQG
jgi:divalent metal cation (Fe/Co/Zn/Cd) transporter